MLSYWFCLLPLATVLSGLSAWSGPADCQARLTTQQQGGMLLITGFCRNQTPSPLLVRYELLTSRRGESGSTQNTQMGSFTVAPAQEKALSQTSVSFSGSDECQVHLRLFNQQGHLLAQDSLTHYPANSH
ncbi:MULTISPECIES: curli-like amyloid fiber formation chaperone CsgH [Hymenobacter]|nr:MULTISPECIES: curli-like amyloid fiber formation chaperone CsgH [Hymenobacter]